MAFYAVPGNHDVHGPIGKHQSTRFVSTPGESVLVTSDKGVADVETQNSVLTATMYCEGIEAGLRPMAEFGFYRQADYIY